MLSGCGLSPVDLLFAQIFAPAESFRVQRGAATDDPCLFELANDPATLPTYDEMRLQLIAVASRHTIICGLERIGGIQSSYCANGDHLILQACNGFGSTIYYFNPDTRELVGITEGSDGLDETCNGQTFYMNRIECGAGGFDDVEDLCPPWPVLF